MPGDQSSSLMVERLSEQIRACRICVEKPDKLPLPHEPRPVCVLSSKAKIRIIGQAPGTRVHASGRPFTDPSGDRLRDWLGMSEDVFYDPNKLAITPMGFCFPGLDKKGGDLPPRKECANRWQNEVTASMPQTRLVLLIGQYAQGHYLLDANLRKRFKSLTQAVESWRKILDSDRSEIQFFPLPHPSWRNSGWIKKHPWFEAKLLPELKRLVAENL